MELTAQKKINLNKAYLLQEIELNATLICLAIYLVLIIRKSKFSLMRIYKWTIAVLCNYYLFEFDLRCF